MIKTSTYNDRLELVEIEFRFLRFAIASLAETKKRKFFDEVDRLPFRRRAEYFDKQMDLPMADEEILKFVGEIMEIRNEISHENPLKTISTADLTKAVKIFSQIPSRVCTKAASIYGKNHFDD